MNPLKKLIDRFDRWIFRCPVRGCVGEQILQRTYANRTEYSCNVCGRTKTVWK